MSDQQKAVVNLSLVSQTCHVALATLGSPSESQSPDLILLHNDLISLLSLLHGSVTKLALALKPSSPTYAASLAPLKELSENVAGLTHCAKLFHPETHGRTLAQEVKSIVTDVILAIGSLVQTFLNIEATGCRGSTGQAGDEYMVRTGAVHDAIDKARNPQNGLSKDNLEAVRKRWVQDRDSLADGLREVDEMVEDESSQVDEDVDDDDDGWDELGLGSSSKMDKNELERTKKVHSILRLTTLLHKRILLDLLVSPLPPNSTTTALDGLLSQSATLLTSSDELVSTLYTPQDPASIRAELSSFLETVRALQPAIRPYLPDLPLEAQLGAMNLGGTTLSGASDSRGKANPRKWFDTCFEQIYKTVRTFAADLELQNT